MLLFLFTLWARNAIPRYRYGVISERSGFCFAGEVGLSGEIRPVNRIEQRIQEAEKLGFTTIFVSKHNKISLKNTGIKVVLVAKIEDVVSELFG